MTPQATTLVPWTDFELEGLALRWSALRTSVKVRPPGWPSHKAAPGSSRPIVMVVVENPEAVATVPSRSTSDLHERRPP